MPASQANPPNITPRHTKTFADLPAHTTHNPAHSSHSHAHTSHKGLCVAGVTTHTTHIRLSVARSRTHATHTFPHISCGPHEAPARLNTQHPADGSPFKKPSDEQIKASKLYAQKLGKELPPLVVGPYGMEMREKKGNPEPKPKPSTSGANNLRPGQVLPIGHVWHPHDQKNDKIKNKPEQASHILVPGHLKDAEQRHPPRPQNHEHYMKQLDAARKKEKYMKNLAMFEKGLPARHGGAVGRAHEAPARMQTHVSHPPAHSEPHPSPPSAQGHQPTAPSPPAHHAGPSNPHPPSAHNGHQPTASGPQAHHAGPSNPHPQHPHHGSKPKPKAGPSRKK